MRSTLLIIGLLAYNSIFAQEIQLSNIISLYLNDQHIPAFRQFKRISKVNHEANYFIGRMYSLGEGVAQNIDSALHYYKKSISYGDKKGYYGIAHDFKSGTKVLPFIDSVDLCFKLAMPAIREAAKNNAFWRLTLSKMLFSGWGIDYPRPDSSLTLLNISDRNYSQIQSFLGIVYEDENLDWLFNLDSVIYWNRKAALNKNLNSLETLYSLYLNGLNPNRNHNEEFNLVKECMHYSPRRDLLLGKFFKYGLGVNQNFDSAFYYLRKAENSKELYWESQQSQSFINSAKKLPEFIVKPWDEVLKLSNNNGKPILALQFDFYRYGHLYEWLSSIDPVLKRQIFENVNAWFCDNCYSPGITSDWNGMAIYKKDTEFTEVLSGWEESTRQLVEEILAAIKE